MAAKRIAAALACLAAVAIVFGLALHLGDGGSTAHGTGGVAGDRGSAGEPSAAAAEPTTAERRIATALKAGVARAAALGGKVEAAAMLSASRRPLVATSEAGGEQPYARMWSISKVATMVAVLRLLGWDDRPGRALSPEVESALEGALTRSENCRQRRVVLELQRLAGGIPEAQNALARVFTQVGGEIVPGTQVEAPESLCVPFLSEQNEIPEPLAPALLLGTSRWRVTDAVRLAHALAVGAYGEAVSSRVLELMRAPKHPSRESDPSELTAPVDWGAGAVFFGLIPAYKAGWGGSLNGNFLASQIAVVPVGGGEQLALAVTFHPATQPSRDDPGITAAPAAIETVMKAVRSVTVPSGGSGE
ncbi:MAG TPA: hypothetical protein VGO36_04385 [Solirubrobacterales bacterium]|jgi:hypothetical protein|nr:hypothetical protein [Solirubrobacterales bacterium]